MVKTKKIIPFLFLFPVLMGSLKAQEFIACNNAIQVSLSANCDAAITADILLRGEMLPIDSTDFTIRIMDDHQNLTGSGSFIGVPGVHEGIGNIITLTQVGTYIATVTRDSDGNNCWSTIVVENKLPLTTDDCPCQDNDLGIYADECIFKCSAVNNVLNDTAFTANLDLNPDFAESCGVMGDILFEDVLNEDSCGYYSITRRWFTRGIGHDGKESEIQVGCAQKFIFEGITGNDVLPPKPRVIIDCGIDVHPSSILSYLSDTSIFKNPNFDSAVICAFPYVYDTIPGFDTLVAPIGKGIKEGSIDAFCNVTATFTDSKPIALCGTGNTKSIKFVRTWHIIDWCQTTTTGPYSQVIKVEDRHGPSFTTPDTVWATTDPWSCAATGQMPKPKDVSDGCSKKDYIRTIISIKGTRLEANEDNNYTINLIPVGAHKLMYRLYDECNNMSMDSSVLIVKDNVAPVATAKKNIVVTLSSNGETCLAKIFPHNIDNGSYDACSEDVDLMIKRDGYPDSTYGDFIKFTNKDIDSIDVFGVPYGIVKVVLKVTDVAGNTNITWSYVRIEDKNTSIQLVCGYPVDVDCKDGLTQAIIYNTPSATSGKCSPEAYTVEYEILSDRVNSICGNGTVTVRYYVPNTNAFCLKEFRVNDDDTLKITWPDSIVYADCLEDDFGDVAIEGAGCKDIFKNVEEQVFELVTGNVCRKIIRKFTVINWCVHDPNTNPNEGIYKFTQVIKVKDDEKPVIENCNDIILNAVDGCKSSNYEVSNSATDNTDCGDELTWQVSLDEYYDGTFDHVLPFSINDTGLITAEINLPLAIGMHRIKWIVTDPCGNTTICTQKITVVDTKAPTPFCIESVSTAVMDGTGSVTIWAMDFDPTGKSIDNCDDEVIYSFSGTDPTATNLTITCNDITNGVSERFTFNLYVYDQSGNVDFCVVELRVDDNIDVCQDLDGGSSAIAGRIYTESGNDVESANVDLEGFNMLELDVTDSFGRYAFGQTPMSFDYDLKALKNDDPMNGISSLDLVLMQRHILGLKDINSPYKVIAADINNDQSISAVDIVELRKLILGIYEEFPNNTSWRFIDADFEFYDNLQPWGFVEKININNLSTSSMNNDFIGIKVGDINGNSIANSLMAIPRSNQKVIVKITDRKVKKGEVVDIHFATAGKAIEMVGVQLGIAVEHADIVSVGSDYLSLNSNNIHYVTEQNLNISWNNISTVLSNKNFITITIRAQKDSYLSELISLNNQNLSSEIYSDVDFLTHKLHLTFDNIEVVSNLGTDFELLQNEPNPFSDATKIGFKLPTAGIATITIFEITGKNVYEVTKEFTSGYHEVLLDKELLGAQGLLYYQLKYNNHSETRKMILID